MPEIQVAGQVLTEVVLPVGRWGIILGAVLFALVLLLIVTVDGTFGHD